MKKKNQGDVLFVKSFSLFPRKVITGFEEKAFFLALDLLFQASTFEISASFTPLFFFLFFFLFYKHWWNFRRGKFEGRCWRAAGCRPGPRERWGLCSLRSDVKHPGEMFVILMGDRHGNSSHRLPALCAECMRALINLC